MSIRTATLRRARATSIRGPPAPRHLDVFNGLLLAPHLDAAFDVGFITISADGTVLVSDALPPGARSSLGLDRRLSVQGLHRGHERCLPWHRSRIFRRGREDAS